MDYKLLEASSRGDLNMVKILLSLNANIHYGYDSPLIHAIKYSHYNIVQYLIENGAYLNEYEYHIIGKPLKLAIKNENLDISTLIITHLRDTKNFECILSEALNTAVKIKNMKMITFLIKMGANVSDGDALYIAVKNNCIGIVTFLIAQRSDINLNCGCPLRTAASNKNFNMVKTLVENGADISNKPFMHSNNPLMISIQKNHIETFKYLLEQGADFHFKNEACLREAILNRNIIFAKYLLEFGANPDANKPTLLFYAIKDKNVEMAELLLNYGADVNIYENLALTRAVELSDIKMITLLLENGAEPNEELIKLSPTKEIRNLLTNFEVNMPLKFAGKHF